MRTAGGVVLPELSDRVEELERQLRELREQPMDTIGSVNETIINSKGEVEVPTASSELFEYATGFEDPAMANWTQSPRILLENTNPILQSQGGVWTPTLGTGLLLTRAQEPVGGENYLALLSFENYFNGSINAPRLGAYMAQLKFTFGVTPAEYKAKKLTSGSFGLRVLDTAKWSPEAKPFTAFSPADAAPALTARVLITNEGKLQLQLVGYSSESRVVALAAINEAARTFWLTAWVVLSRSSGTGGNFWQFAVWDCPPFDYASESRTKSAEPLASLAIEFGAMGHRKSITAGVRMGLIASCEGPAAQVEKGLASINELRVRPL
jgi:hypothetical protein